MACTRLSNPTSEDRISNAKLSGSYGSGGLILKKANGKLFGLSNGICVAEDGKTFLYTGSSVYSIKDIAYGLIEGVPTYVAVGAGGGIYVSHGPTDEHMDWGWQEYEPDDNYVSYFRTIIYANGYFVAGGVGGGDSGSPIQRSVDGETWEAVGEGIPIQLSNPAPNPSDYTIFDFAYGNDTYVAVGYWYEAGEPGAYKDLICTSPNAEDWTVRASAMSPSPGRGLSAVEFTGNHFVAAGGAFLASGEAIEKFILEQSEDDGETWEDISNNTVYPVYGYHPPGYSVYNYLILCYHNKKIYLLGDLGDVQVADVSGSSGVGVFHRIPIMSLEGPLGMESFGDNFVFLFRMGSTYSLLLSEPWILPVEGPL